MTIGNLISLLENAKQNPKLSSKEVRFLDENDSSYVFESIELIDDCAMICLTDYVEPDENDEDFEDEDEDEVE
jgi:hypothetical protein